MAVKATKSMPQAIGMALTDGIEKDYGWMKGVFCRRKSLRAILDEAQRDQEIGTSKLNLLDLLCIGVGSTIGSGVFALTGKVACYMENGDGTLRPMAGPSAVLSWMIAGLACFLSAFAYMELSARLPTKGSCYVFSYHGLGELPAVIGSVCLTMEYGMSAAGVARDWSAKLSHMLGPDFESWAYAGKNSQFDFFAALITFLCAVMVMSGLNCGKMIINAFTLMKVILVIFLILAGFAAAEVNPFESLETFFPFGFNGTLQGSSALFFGFIGFDEVCCMASKAQNPAKTMPRAIAGTLLGAVIFSGLAQLSLAFLGPACIPDEQTVGLPFELAFDQMAGWPWAAWITHVGELVLLPLVVLLAMLPQPEVTAAMAEDKLLPSMFAAANEEGVFVQGAAISGAILTLLALAVPFSILWDVISLGVLVGFNLTNASLLMIRYGNGGKTRKKRAAALVWGLFSCTAIFSYVFWQGWAQPLLLGMKYSTLPVVLSSIFFAVSIIIMLVLRIGFDQVGDVKGNQDIFRAPAVPFVPGAAMMVNYLMMAQLPWGAHRNFMIFIAIVFFVYVAYTGTKRAVTGMRHDASNEVGCAATTADSSEDDEDDDDGADSDTD